MKPARSLALAAVTSLVLLAGSAFSASAWDSGGDPPKPAPPTDPGVVAPQSAHPQYRGDVVFIPAGGFAFAHVNCPAGMVPTGGGGQTGSTLTLLTDSLPSPSGWTVGVKNTDTGQTNTASAWVVCTSAAGA
ncbi:hypothetical protein M8Z33_33570 [Streptomyces sp. ZAF1911]|uniref:hypothetical protein n=1 Tax=Streptomyces sp. ZAF1911 TaxID=2944129 RepID=UPI00237AD4A3|nr:hypothetical protein [Streptomyces sp. ZAF1911]MDD9381494.1 hypothetical protein [Streptomyces sp. ZAF1911]